MILVFQPLNIVMKTTLCNGQDVAKISDVEGKGMCKNDEYVDYLKRSIKWRMEHESEELAFEEGKTFKISGYFIPSDINEIYRPRLIKN